MVLADEFKYRVDEQRFNDALDAADFLAQQFSINGRYNVEESWGPEGILYLAESSWALMDAYRITKKRSYIEAVEAILNALRLLQKENGGWSLDLGKSGVGFKVTEEQRIDSTQYADLPPTSAFLRTIAEYQDLTGDNSYFDMGERAFDFLLPMWDAASRTFVDTRQRDLLKLRSNPNSYHLFFLIGLSAWQKYQPEQIGRMYPVLLHFVKENLQGFDIKTMPLICALHAAALTDFCDKDFIETVIKPKITDYLVNNDVFKIQGVPGGYGHRDGLRGIVISEAHMRSCAGIAIAMKKYDLATGTNTFRDTEQYENIATWIDNMKGNGFYYEFEILSEGRKLGWGSPGQYLPIWWILGKL